jgi:hydrogen peroxide-dependent heme synthase
MRSLEVPETLDGWAILHRMFHFDRRRFDGLEIAARERIARETVAFLEPLQASADSDVSLAQMLGHKCDLMLTHYARSWDELASTQMRFDKIELREYLTSTTSYVSILELGLYEASAKIHAELQARAVKPRSPEWNAAFDALLAEQALEPRNAARLWAKVPERKYVCFYPMDKKRGEAVNWYTLPYVERARLMLDHGKIGRSYHGLVTQVISGSIGFDDYEWGVDLYADDPLVFKKLIAEMRYDKASAAYAVFGPFYTGVRLATGGLAHFLEGVNYQ